MPFICRLHVSFDMKLMQLKNSGKNVDYLRDASKLVKHLGLHCFIYNKFKYLLLIIQVFLSGKNQFCNLASRWQCLQNIGADVTWIEVDTGGDCRPMNSKNYTHCASKSNIRERSIDQEENRNK